VDQEVLEVIETMITDETIPQPCGWYKKRSIEDAGKDECVFERDALIVEATVRKIGEVSLARVPRKRFLGR
jgi:hypothetical protein